ncbi:MAG: aldo/keto reductase [Myxococcales bacterium]|nr:aldo/keto reductase [Myxococcales bacterium]
MGVAASGTFRIGGELPVHRLGFGAMRVCGPGIWGHPADAEASRGVLRQVVELGVTLVDTADAYGPEVSEYLLAEALHPYAPGLVIATKGGLVRGGPGDWGRDGRPEHLERAVANSLRRLRLEAIDLYQLHAPDPEVPFEASVTALAKAREAGLIRHVGLSNVSVDQLRQARAIVPIATVQNRYNLTDREHEPVLAACEQAGIGFIPWYPLATGKLATGEGVLARVAGKHEATPSQVALAWLLAKSPVMLPIPGTSSPAHLAENCAAADLSLDADDVATLTAMA